MDISCCLTLQMVRPRKNSTKGARRNPPRTVKGKKRYRPYDGVPVKDCVNCNGAGCVPCVIETESAEPAVKSTKPRSTSSTVPKASRPKKNDRKPKRRTARAERNEDAVQSCELPIPEQMHGCEPPHLRQPQTKSDSPDTPTGQAGEASRVTTTQDVWFHSTSQSTGLDHQDISTSQ